MTTDPLQDTPLTEEQRAIVAHDGGPALVFAVAGAGKTTAMTYRVERLVREGVFPAKSILATSFSKASVRDIKTALARWPHCAGVPVQTLHAVGWGVVRAAQRRGHLAGLGLASDDEGGDGMVLARTLSSAWRDKVDYAPELDGLDRQDFLTYVGVMKANLRYADLARAELPASALAHAGPATRPPGMEWYRDLYALYERVRVAENVLTFDDMLLTGWEALHRWPDVRDDVCRRFGCVLVDEFQDVSRVQCEMLDLLTFPHRNYMAIGDDDQTIYEWRGADPGFILGFRARYGAAQYVIRDNFRSHAAPLALANRVIAHNTRREPKRLSLTRGFGGGAFVHSEDSAAAQGRHIAQIIADEQGRGRRLAEVAVLVRLYAQTPFLEHALIGAGLPYTVIGGSPFYARPEVTTLRDYLRLGQAERDGVLPDDWEARWHRIANRPARYLSRAVCEAVAQAVRHERIPLSQALARFAEEAPGRQADRLGDLADLLRWLAGALDTLPAPALLALLDSKLGYSDFLKSSSGFPETGAARAANVESLTRYAQGCPSGEAFAAHLDGLAARNVGRGRAGEDAVSLLTVFRAKGLQWPVVFVPDCNGGTFPYGGPDEMEEERRLFYVALTRTQADLHLHVVRTETPSPFLREADWEATLRAVRQLGDLRTLDPDQWRTGDTLAFARHTAALGLERYFGSWCDLPPGQARRLARHVQGLYEAARGLGISAGLGLSDAPHPVWTRFGPSAPDAARFADLADHAPSPPARPDALPDPSPAAHPSVSSLQIGGRIRHAQHGEGVILAVRGDRSSPRLEIQFARGRPVILPARHVQWGPA